MKRVVRIMIAIILVLAWTPVGALADGQPKQATKGRQDAGQNKEGMAYGSKAQKAEVGEDGARETMNERPRMKQTDEERAAEREARMAEKRAKKQAAKEARQAERAQRAAAREAKDKTGQKGDKPSAEGNAKDAPRTKGEPGKIKGAVTDQKSDASEM